MPNAQEEFLESLKGDDIKLNDDSQFMEAVKPAVPPAEKPEGDGKDDDSPRNRREKRLMAKLQAEKEANIALNERLRVQSELKEKAADTKSIDPDLVRLFGDTPEGKLAQEMFSKKFSETEENAYKRALGEIKAENERLEEVSAQDSREIDDGFSSVEDEYNVDLSGDTKESAALRNGFIDFLTTISPKDKNGEIVEYADFESSFDVYRKLAEKGKPREVSERQKALADRSMASGGQRQPSQAPKGPVNFNMARRYIDNLYDQQQKGNL